MKFLSTILFFLAVSTGFVTAQTVLTPEEAVNIALKNNYSIMVARNDADIARINNTMGNAGMLPTLAINASDNGSLNNAHQKLSTGVETRVTAAHSNTFTAGPVLTWTLFDGSKMFVTKQKLNEIQDLGELQFKDQVQQTVYDVIATYFDVVRQKQQLSSINEVIAYNLERVKIFQTSLDAGLTPKTNLLQAKIDLNVYQEDAVSQKTVILEAKRKLNQILGRSADSTFEVMDSIPLMYHPDRKSLMDKLYSANNTVLAFQKQLDIARLGIKEMNTLLLPRLSISAGYNFLKTDNTFGTLLMNRTYGPQFGGTISIPIFQGGNASRQIKTARVQALSAEYNLESIKLQINTLLLNAFSEFENQEQLLAIERDNAILAKENLEISMLRLRYGQTTSLEVRLAQDSYEQSMTRLLNFEYNTKIAETKLKQLLAEL
jgi:outer membrane protein TolC